MNNYDYEKNALDEIEVNLEALKADISSDLKNEIEFSAEINSNYVADFNLYQEDFDTKFQAAQNAIVDLEELIDNYWGWKGV
ncbi:TPA: hypothetical protein ACGWER_001787 [Streptococcus agalactiae]